MNRQAVAQELVKVAKLLSASERVLATNSSSYSWEDFYSTATAKVYLDEATDKLRLEIRKDVENTGINPHKGSELAAELDLGTLQKPRLGGVPTLLKQHGHDRTTAGGPFPRLWTDVKRNSKEALAQIIKEELARKQPSSAVSSPATKPMPTPEDQAVLKQMLKNIDVATIAVENAQEEIERAITTGDRKKVEYALGVLHTSLDTLRDQCRDYQLIVGKLV
jgi:hypothetical protein